MAIKKKPFTKKYRMTPDWLRKEQQVVLNHIRTLKEPHILFFESSWWLLVFPAVLLDRYRNPELYYTHRIAVYRYLDQIKRTLNRNQGLHEKCIYFYDAEQQSDTDR